MATIKARLSKTSRRFGETAQKAIGTPTERNYQKFNKAVKANKAAQTKAGISTDKGTGNKTAKGRAAFNTFGKAFKKGTVEAAGKSRNLSSKGHVMRRGEK